ncbi:MAG: hypothetical protein WB799_09280 [Candidatus Sulfotelmatobacter sp.]
MAEVVQDAQHEFWRSPIVLEPSADAAPPAAAPAMAEACADCATEFMIGARFCHACGRRRPLVAVITADAALIAGLWARNVEWVRTLASSIAAARSKISFPGWLRYLHFHEIKRCIGLPTAALIAFMIGLSCVAGAIGLSLFYRASNLAEFQAIQMWRIEWLLAATASFVAGILLKKPSHKDQDNDNV